VGGSPTAVAAALGSVWVVDSVRGQLLRVDPRSGEVVGRSPAGRAPVAVAAGDGAVWVAGAGGTVQRFDAATGEPTGTAERVPAPGGIAVGEGAVWVTSQSGGTVTALDPSTGRRQGRPIEVGPRPADVAVGGGAVWVANGAQMDGTVSRVDPGSRKAEEPIEVVDGQLFALTYGEDGVWAAGSSEMRGDRIDVLRIDPDSSEVDDKLVRLDRPGLPVRLAAGAGSVWVAQGGAGAGGLTGGEGPSGTLARLDPDERRRTGSVARLPGPPTGVSIGEGGVWTAISGDGAVVRAEP